MRAGVYAPPRQLLLAVVVARGEKLVGGELQLLGLDTTFDQKYHLAAGQFCLNLEKKFDLQFKNTFTMNVLFTHRDFPERDRPPCRAGCH